MNFTLRQLRYLSALAEARNFGRAAEAVHVSQPALSAQIAQLEEALGGVLVERLPRDVVLTPLGRAVLDHAHKVLRAAQDLSDICRHSDTMTLHLGIIPTIAPYLLPNLLQIIRAQYPGWSLHIHEAKTTTLVTDLHKGELDAVIAALPVEADGLEQRALFTDRFLLAGTRETLARLMNTADPIAPSALAREQLILLEEGHCLADQTISICGADRQSATLHMGASSMATLSRLVEAGFGLTLMPEMAATQETGKGSAIELVRFAKPEPGRTIGLLTRPADYIIDHHEMLAAAITEAGRRLVRPS